MTVKVRNFDVGTSMVYRNLILCVAKFILTTVILLVELHFHVALHYMPFKVL